MAGKLDAAGKKFLKDRFRTYIHSILPGKDGRLFLVTEQFRELYGLRTVRTQIGNTMQPSTETYVEMVTMNIAIYELGEDYSLASARIFQKKEDLNFQPAPFAKLDIFIVAQMAATLRQYDFLSVQPVKGSGYVISFRDRDSDITRILHLRLDNEGKMEMKKAEYPSVKKFEYRVYPAKDGYVLKMDFSKSKKQASLSLQPVNQ